MSESASGESNFRKVKSRIQVLLTPNEVEQVKLSGVLAQQELRVRAIDLACEPDNMLVTQFQQQEARQPVSEVLHLVELSGETNLADTEVTQAVVARFPKHTYWYGTTMTVE
ncbi:hypothetical protein [Corynebacterium freiburgense]|uniref:hypothetical protein n=1 Tax=Corynebacterium freiburgense TaxID=556548 RepID=UPI000425B35A|nr:hypothetical protein [Corynebacterium freiburgense]WJZ03039.1 hypothetical protein CFREI_08805 [Corynebacterium freiburgense]